MDVKDTLGLISVFANTWFSLDAYDEENFPKKGWKKSKFSFTAEDLKSALIKLKKNMDWA